MSAGRAMAEMLMRIAESERKNVQVRIWGLHIFLFGKVSVKFGENQKNIDKWKEKRYIYKNVLKNRFIRIGEINNGNIHHAES